VGAKSVEDWVGCESAAIGYIAQGIQVWGGWTDCKTGKTTMYEFTRTEYFRKNGGDLWEILKPACSMGWIRFKARAVYLEDFKIPAHRIHGHPITKDQPSIPGVPQIKIKDYTRASNDVWRSWEVRWNCCNNKKMDPGVKWYIGEVIR
jgi:hypothetical protein